MRDYAKTPTSRGAASSARASTYAASATARGLARTRVLGRSRRTAMRSSPGRSQSWSNGKVGMLAISWGASTRSRWRLRKRRRSKPSCGAATEELFKEDVHYMDGVSRRRVRAHHGSRPGATGAPDFSLEESADRPAYGPPALVAYLHEASARRRLLAAPLRRRSRS